MSDVRDELEHTRAFWNRVAGDWKIQVGDEGDPNRRLNSDPVLWSFLGGVSGQRVLDAGCGTGYLTRQLAARGAHVTGIDLSDAMIAIARRDAPELDFRVDGCSTLATLDDACFDAVVSNYVMMDTPDLEGAAAAFFRVLKPGGRAVVVFSHPCFPQGSAEESADGRVRYVWDAGYFDRQRRVDPPWHHFTSPFTWYHRPLSDYWKAFMAAGFTVLDFEEPRIAPERYAEVTDARRLRNSRERPYSVAFLMGRPDASTTSRMRHDQSASDVRR